MRNQNFAALYLPACGGVGFESNVANSSHCALSGIYARQIYQDLMASGPWPRPEKQLA